MQVLLYYIKELPCAYIGVEVHAHLLVHEKKKRNNTVGSFLTICHNT